MQIGYMYDTLFLKHDTGAHLEIASRVAHIDAMVCDKYDVIDIAISQGNKEDLYRIHEPTYVDWVEHGYEKGVRNIVSSDTVLSPHTYEVALRVATSTKHVIRGFKEGSFSRAFLNIRPPGHHAEYGMGQGFCIFNNIAMMAKYAQDAGYKKVFILDFDVHHGNGTQDIFYADKSVYYMSMHERHNYPYTGTEEELGESAGLGYNCNFPYEDDIDDTRFVALFDNLPKEFHPDIILVSAGYDMMADEQISTTHISDDGLRAMLDKIISYAGATPLAFLLEGGYEIESLVQSVDSTMEKLTASI